MYSEMTRVISPNGIILKGYLRSRIDVSGLPGERRLDDVTTRASEFQYERNKSENRAAYLNT